MITLSDVLYTGSAPRGANHKPSDPSYWCAWCALVLKQMVTEAHKDDIQDAVRAEGSEPVWFNVTVLAYAAGFHELQPAVTVAPCAMLNGIPLPLCWSHLPGIAQQSPLAQAVQGVLPNGQPVPELGRRQR